jgi:hypothetical protein
MVLRITFDRADVFTGRAGALLRGTFGSTGGGVAALSQGQRVVGLHCSEPMRLRATRCQDRVPRRAPTR